MALPLLSRLRLPRGMDRVRWLFGGWTLAVLLFLYLPIVVLVAYSFNAADYGGRWEGATTKWYSAYYHRTVADLRDSLAPADAGWRHAVRGLLDAAGAEDAEAVRRSLKFERVWGQIPGFNEGVRVSLLVGMVSTAASVVLGTLAAWLTFRYRYPMHRALLTLVAVPMVVPEIIMGVGLLSLITLAAGVFGDAVSRGLVAVILAHVTFSFPYVMVTIQARLAGLDPALEEAAMDLGATPLTAFGKVIVPQLMPAILGGTLMAFTLSLDDFIVTYFVSDAGSQTLPLRIYGAYKGPPPMLHVVSSLMIGLTVLLVVAGEGLKRFNRSSKETVV